MNSPFPLLAIALTMLVALAPAPSHAELPVAELKRDTPVDFATEVYPFLKANCLACHNSSKAKADLSLESPQDMLKGGDSGPAVEPGDGEYSLIFSTAAHLEDPIMPPANNKSKAKNLTPVELALLRRWIDEGAKGEAVATPAPEKWSLLTGPQPIYTAAISGDGRFAAAGRGQQIHLYDLRLGVLAATLVDPSLEHQAAHRDIVQAIAFSPDGRVASGGYRTTKIWRREPAAAGEPVPLPPNPHSLAISRDGKRSAIGASDGSILIHTFAPPGIDPITIKDHAGAVSGLAFSPDGQVLYSVSADKSVKKRPLSDPKASTSLTLPAAASSLAVIDGGEHLALGGTDNVLRICKADLSTAFAPSVPPTPKSETPPPAPKDQPQPKEQSPAPEPAKSETPTAPAPKPTPVPDDAAKAKPSPATPNPEPTKEPETKPVTPPPVPKEAPKPAPPAPAPKYVEHRYQASPLVAVACANAGGTEFLIGHADGTAILLKFDSTKPEALPAQLRRFSHGGPLARMAVSFADADAPRLATAGPTGPVHLWNLATAAKVAELKGDPGRAAEIAALADHKNVATRLKSHWDKRAPEEETLWKAEAEKANEAGSGVAVALRDLSSKRDALVAARSKAGAKPEEVETAQTEFQAAARALDKARGDRELSARLAGEGFARQTEALARSLEADALAKALQAEIDTLTKAESDTAAKAVNQGLSFSPDGTVFVQAVDGQIRLRSAQTGAWLEDAGVVPPLLDLAHVGNRLLTVGLDSKLTPWTLPGSRWVLAHTLGDGKEPDPFIDRVSALGFSPFGDRLVTGAGVPSRNGEIVTWDTETWQPVFRNEKAHSDAVTSIAFSPEGDRFASASTDGTVKVHDTESGEVLLTFEGHTDHVLDVAWNADDLTIASAGADQQVKVWDLRLGQEASKDERFEGEVSAVAFLGTATNLLTASGDKSLKIDAQPIPGAGQTFLHVAAVSDDGKRIVAGGQDSTLRIWDGGARKLILEFPAPDAGKGTVASE